MLKWSRGVACRLHRTNMTRRESSIILLNPQTRAEWLDRHHLFVTVWTRDIHIPHLTPSSLQKYLQYRRVSHILNPSDVRESNNQYEARTVNKPDFVSSSCLFLRIGSSLSAIRCNKKWHCYCRKHGGSDHLMSISTWAPFTKGKNRPAKSHLLDS